MNLKKILKSCCKYLGISIGLSVITAIPLAILAGYGYNWYVAVTAHNMPWWVHWTNWNAALLPLATAILGAFVGAEKAFSAFIFFLICSSLPVAIANLVNVRKKKVDSFFGYSLDNYPLSSPNYSGWEKFSWFFYVLFLAIEGIIISAGAIALLGIFGYFFSLFLKFSFEKFSEFLKFVREDKRRIFLVFFWFLNIITLFYGVVYSIQLAGEIEIDWPRWMLVESSGSKRTTTVLFILLLTSLPLLQLIIKFLPKFFQNMPHSSKKRSGDGSSCCGGCCGIIKKGYEKVVEFVGNIKDYIVKEKNTYFAQCLWIFEWLYFTLSIAGIIIAIQYTKTGSLISVVSTVEQRISEKARDWFKGEDLEETKLLGLLEEGKGLEYLDEIKNKENKNLKETLVLRLLNSEGLKLRSGQVSLMEKESSISEDRIEEIV